MRKGVSVRRIRLVRLLIESALCAANAVAGAQQVATMQQLLDGKMHPDVEVHTFEHTDQLYPVDRIRTSHTPSPLPESQTRVTNVSIQSSGKTYDLFDYMALNRVAGLLILKDGRVVLEQYALGANRETRWASFSMAKSVTSTLIAAALSEGTIHSLDDRVPEYVPALRGSVYDEVTIRDLLEMSSGVRWDETYTDPSSDCRKLTDAQLTHRPGASIGYMKTLGRAAQPGSVWNYDSGETNIAGAVVEGATHLSLAAYLEKTIWKPLGMKRDATWWTESPGGMGLGGVGLAATLRDYGRFGLFVMHDGVIDGRQIVPKGWFDDAGSPHVIGSRQVQYGYLWWPSSSNDALQQGAFEARGIFGQRLYVNRRERVVIVILSARPKPTGTTVIDDSSFFEAAVRALH